MRNLYSSPAKSLQFDIIHPNPHPFNSDDRPNLYFPKLQAYFLVLKKNFFSRYIKKKTAYSRYTVKKIPWSDP